MKISGSQSFDWPFSFRRGATNASAHRRRKRSHRSWLLLRRLRAWFLASLSEGVNYSRSNLVLFGIIATVAHPLYYILWHVLYPQPFDSFWLRIFSAAVSFPMIFTPRLSRYQLWRRALPYYWLALATYQLPFFFVFMSLMNGFSTIWAMSTMAACLFLVLLIPDWLLIVLIATVGTAAAWLCFLLTGDGLNTDYSTLGQLIPIYLFALGFGSVFNYKKELVTNEKLAAITAAVGTIAHELRTPLLGIRSGASGVRGYFPAILEGYELAREHGLPVRSIRSAHYREMQSVLGRIVNETEYSSVILDMLLVNSSGWTRIDRSRFGVYRIEDCIDTALARYPFHNARQRERVHWQRDVDFEFHGSDVLLVHVLLNLLKNALYFIDRVADGHVHISTERAGAGVNKLRFLDTGAGIAPEELPRIFDRFYSGMPAGQGTGIGLAFAQLVMHSFEGDIFCRSEFGRFTEFVLVLPAVDSNERQ